MLLAVVWQYLRHEQHLKILQGTLLRIVCFRAKKNMCKQKANCNAVLVVQLVLLFPLLLFFLMSPASSTQCDNH